MHAEKHLLDHQAAAAEAHGRYWTGRPRRTAGGHRLHRSRLGSKHHVLIDGGGIPCPSSLTGGNRNDVIALEALLDAVPDVRGRLGLPRRRPKTLYGEVAYDHDKCRRHLRARGITSRVSRRGEFRGSGLGTVIVERTIAQYHGMKRLRIRRERCGDIHEVLLGLAACVICYRHVRRFC